MTLSADPTATGAEPVGEIHIWRATLAGRGSARLTLRRVLGRYLETGPEQVALRLGRHGKPALADPGASLRFNLSHSGGTMLLAVARGREVGVDVELIRPRGDVLALARRALEPAAAAAVETSPPAARLAAFYAAWTRREAIAKCAGVGLTGPSPGDGFAVGTLDAGPGFAAAIAVEGDDLPPLRYLDAEQAIAGPAAST